MAESRVKNSIRNIMVGVGGQSLSFVLAFISRKIFVMTLADEYLGINGFLGEIFTILSLAEFGFGNAITFCMYKPIAEGDNEKLRGLVGFLKKIYLVVAGIFIAGSLVLLPFLRDFSSDYSEIPYLELIFVLYAVSSVQTYFFAYKQTFLNACQKSYICSFYTYLYTCIRNVVQIGVLLWTHNFILYLVIQNVCVLISNISISRKANKLYPEILKEKGDVDKETRADILKNVKAVFISKIGNTLVNNTDNMIIVKYVGLIESGFYSNYKLVINGIFGITSTCFNALSGSIGNLLATETKEKSKEIFDTLNYACYWIIAFSTCSFFVLLNPFISIWLGEKYTFGTMIVGVICLNYYIGGMREMVLKFKEANGLFWYDRYKSIVEALINLVLSIILAKKIGFVGVMLGTTIAELCTSVWVEPFILFKYGFKTSILGYYIKYIKYMLFTFAITGVTYQLSLMMPDGFIGFCLKVFLCAVIPNVAIFILHINKREQKQLIGVLKSKVIKKRTEGDA